jgi:hypothetical protein
MAAPEEDSEHELVPVEPMFFNGERMVKESEATEADRRGYEAFIERKRKL